MRKILAYIAGTSVVCILLILYFNSRITFSIIIPVYNAEKYLPRCLDSVFAQNGSYEVIAVNDGSTDNSLKILREYAAKHSNMKIIDQKNGGVSVARNAGLKAAENKYITFTDADDWLEADAFEKATAVLKKDKSDVLLTGFYDVYDREWVKNIRGEEYVNKVPAESKYRNRDLDKLMLFSPFYGKDAYSDLFYAGGGVRLRFFKKDFIEKYHIDFPSGINCNEDAVFTFRIFLNNPLISVLPAPLHNYRNRADSMSKSKYILKKTSESLAAMQNTPEFKQSSRRTQMLINDSWLFLIILGMSNLQRHNIAVAEGLDEAYKAYKSMHKYNTEELRSCRNYQKLRKYLSLKEINQPL